MNNQLKKSVLLTLPMLTLKKVLVELIFGMIVIPATLLAFTFCLPLVKFFIAKGSHKNTAGGVATLRYIASLEKDARLQVKDPYAKHFVSRSALVQFITFAIESSDICRCLLIFVIEVLHPGAYGHSITRTHHIDQQIKYIVTANGVGTDTHSPMTQLVILGAGYDMRAYRLPLIREKCRVFELDQPAMSAEKQASISSLRLNCDHVSFLTIDFNKEKISDVLLNNTNFDITATTLFLWEGVQVYLPPDAVDTTLAEIAHVGRKMPDSASAFLWFTFADSHVFDKSQTMRIRGSRQYQKYASQIGESMKSGIDPETLGQFLGKREFKVVDGVAGLPGHMTPAMKNDVFLDGCSIIRTSEVFHNVLCKVV